MQFKSLKTRVLLWFGMVSFVVLTLFGFTFNYFLNNSINNNIKNKLQFIAHKYNDHIETKNIGVAVINSGKIVQKNSAFTLKKYKKYLKKKKNFFIINSKHNDDYIDALYLERRGNKTIMIVKKNIDNKIEDFQDTLLFLIPILLFVLIFLASKLIDKILLPINKLRESTKNISITRFTQEIEIPKNNDEIRELVLSFNAMIKRLKGGVERLDRFNSDVSHELRTPLTVIQGEIEITLKKLREPQEYETSLKVIQKQSWQITRIVNQLLLLTKYSKENIQESFQNCALDSMLLATIDKFQTQLNEKNLKLSIKKIEPINFKANPILMESLFTNLIDNALKYTQKDKTITLSLFQDSKIHFTIEDEGIGIPKEHLQKITERFYRADSARNKKIAGFGLGLSIVQNSVFMHNGTLQIKSEEGNGTVVSVVF